MLKTTKQLETLKARRKRLENQLLELDRKISSVEDSEFFRIRKASAERNKKVYELRKKSGMKWKEVAAHFQVSISTAKKYVDQYLLEDSDFLWIHDPKNAKRIEAGAKAARASLEKRIKTKEDETRVPKRSIYCDVPGCNCGGYKDVEHSSQSATNNNSSESALPLTRQS